MADPRLLSTLASRSISDLHGVGEKKLEAFKAVGVETVLDLLTYYPRRYIDRTQERSIADLLPGDQAMVLARVEKTTGRRMKNGRMLTEVKISDESGVLYVTFFNQPWRVKQLLADTEAVFFGKVDVYRNKMQMTNPLVDFIGDKTGKIVPVYPQSEKAGLATYEIAQWVEESLRRAGEFADPLTERQLDELDVADRTWAMRQVHVPEAIGAAYKARRRLAFDELLRLQTILVLRKRALERESQGFEHVTDGSLTKEFFSSLPFPLTGAQERCIADIANDLRQPQPMHRLLQGDVGAGKTLVALAMLLMSVQGGHQGALMAPTEVLAEQHFLGLRTLLANLTITEEGSLLGDRPLNVALLTNRTTAAERRKLHAGLLDGTVDILVGTHALLTDVVQFKSLGAVVIDEQHRFGVEQRAALREKNGVRVPDVLVMTATPIPRTAAMTVYGDLDVSVLDELPPGRTPIRTEWAQSEMEEASAWGRVRDVVAAGQQAYVVCPLVDESERVMAKSATTEFERLQAQELTGLRLGLLHGQIKSDEREVIMGQFRNRELDVLVATTVIEVGVDVPNATVMVIEDAARFGIAQLHQLRGRVGRGADKSFCYLLGEATTDEAEERLKALVRTTDGFELAEVDLDLRGSGSIMGARQKGRSDLKLASLKRNDREMIEVARAVATEIIDADPFLEKNPVLLDDISQLVDEEEAEFLFKS